MKEKINEEVLCVLRKENNNQVEIGYINIINPFKNYINELSNLCDKPETTIKQIVDYIQNTAEFEKLTSYYRYCVSLRNAYQGFSANNNDFINKINQQYQLILINKNNNPYNYKLEEAIKALKIEIKSKYILWTKAYAINEAYRICQEDKSILTFSHRIVGWSNPIYQLTPNFSVEIKTNFGFGSVSYFYTILKYKNIEITPFSEWIEYEFAKFSEIIRYTQTYILQNEYWLEAMEFARNACNLSLQDEIMFVEKYVIEECEKMVSGLEQLFSKKHFTFKNRERITYSVDKKGHVLVEFQGEKISGALDFISKIMDFDKIAEIKSFIKRIEECNFRILPILHEEAKSLKIIIEKLLIEKNNLQPNYDKVVKANNEYNLKRSKLQAELISKGELNAIWIDTIRLEINFLTHFPEYENFKEEYIRVSESYRILTEQIQNYTKVKDNIISYYAKITSYIGI